MWDFSHDYFWGNGDEDANETSRTSNSHGAGSDLTGNGTSCSHGVVVGFFMNPLAMVKFPTIAKIVQISVFLMS